MSSQVVKFLLGATKGLGYLGAAGVAVEVVETVAHHTGILPKESRLVPATTRLVLQALEIPQAPERAAPSLGHAPAVVDAQPNEPPAISAVVLTGQRDVCPDCYRSQPISLAGAGESAAELRLVRCGAHEAEAVELAGHMGQFFDTWAEAYGVSLEAGPDCGAKPNSNDYKNMWGNVEQDKYYKALSKWQGCKAKQKEAQLKADQKADAKAAKAAAKEAADDAATAKKAEAAKVAAVEKAKKTAKKLSDFALSATKAKYEKQVKDLLAAQAAEKDAAAKAAMQQQIDAANQAKLDAERLLAETNARAQSTEHQRQIDALRAEIAANAQKPQGMDQMFQQIMMARMMAPPAAPAPVAPAPVMMADPSAMMAAQMMQPAMMQPAAFPFFPSVDPMAAMMATDPMALDPMAADMWLSGNDGGLEIDAELAGELGLQGVDTLGEARVLFDVKNAGWSEEEVNRLLADMRGTDEAPMPGCKTQGLGSCGL